MKNIVFIFALAFSFSPLSHAGLFDNVSSEDFDFGFVAGVNRSVIDNSAAIETASLTNQTTPENKIGFSAGVRGRFHFNERLNFGLDINYSRYQIKLLERTTSLASTETERNVDLDYLNFRPHFTFTADFGLSLSLGYNFGISTNAEIEQTQNTLGLQTTTNRILNDVDPRHAFFGSVGFEWQIGEHKLVPEIGYELSLMEAFSVSNANALTGNLTAFNALDDTRINTFYFQLAFLF